MCKIYAHAKTGGENQHDKVMGSRRNIFPLEFPLVIFVSGKLSRKKKISLRLDKF